MKLQTSQSQQDHVIRIPKLLFRWKKKKQPFPMYSHPAKPIHSSWRALFKSAHIRVRNSFLPLRTLTALRGAFTIPTFPHTSPRHTHAPHSSAQRGRWWQYCQSCAYFQHEPCGSLHRSPAAVHTRARPLVCFGSFPSQMTPCSGKNLAGCTRRRLPVQTSSTRSTGPVRRHPRRRQS